MSIYDLATLADQLAELYPTIDDARRILAMAGFNTIEIEYSTRPRDNWWNILQVSAYKKGALSSLLALVIKDYPDNKLISVLMIEIVQLETPAEGRVPSDEPTSKRKKLIKGFEQFLEELGHKSGSKGLFDKQEVVKDLDWFQKLMNISKAVGLIKTPTSSTSAILLADGYVLTFFLNVTPESLSNINLIMQYDSDDQQLNQEHNLELDPSFVHNNELLHYTLLRRHNSDKNFHLHVPLVDWKDCINKEVNLISHPLGKAKRISGGKIVGENNHELYYNTDSAPGSAGGPVIYNNGVMAMHVGRKEITKEGDQPTKFGIKISDILEDAGLPVNNFMK